MASAIEPAEFAVGPQGRRARRRVDRDRAAGRAPARDHRHPPLRRPRLQGPGSARPSADLLRRPRPRRVRPRPGRWWLLPTRELVGRPGARCSTPRWAAAAWCSSATRWARTPRSPTRSRTASGLAGLVRDRPRLHGLCRRGGARRLGPARRRARAGWGGGLHGGLRSRAGPGLARDGPALHPRSGCCGTAIRMPSHGPCARCRARRPSRRCRSSSSASSRRSSSPATTRPIRAIPTRSPPPTRSACPRPA